MKWNLLPNLNIHASRSYSIIEARTNPTGLIPVPGFKLLISRAHGFLFVILRFFLGVLQGPLIQKDPANLDKADTAKEEVHGSQTGRIISNEIFLFSFIFNLSYAAVDEDKRTGNSVV